MNNNGINMQRVRIEYRGYDTNRGFAYAGSALATASPVGPIGLSKSLIDARSPIPNGVTSPHIGRLPIYYRYTAIIFAAGLTVCVLTQKRNAGSSLYTLDACSSIIESETYYGVTGTARGAFFSRFHGRYMIP